VHDIHSPVLVIICGQKEMDRPPGDSIRCIFVTLQCDCTKNSFTIHPS